MYMYYGSSPQRMTALSIHRGTHGSIKYGPVQVLFFNRELRIADHYFRPSSESYINI